jgi:hypothetical protein
MHFRRLARTAEVGWSEALRLVTGHQVDLRGLCNGSAMIAPSVIWLQKDPRYGASLLMGDNKGQPAIDRMVQALQDLSEIMPSVQRSRYKLMDIDQLRSAATVLGRETTFLTFLNASVAQLVSETSPSEDGIDGSYRRRLAIVSRELKQEVSAQSDLLTAGPRPVGNLLEDATQALSAFGTRMASAFYTAQPQLVEIAQTFWDGANTNLRAYWQANGWGPGGANSRMFQDAPEEAESRWRAAMAAYSSDRLPGLPAGTPTIATDLDDGWWAFGDALTARLSQVLDTMDEEANAAFTDLRHAYEAVLGALNVSTGSPTRGVGIPGEPAVPLRRLSPVAGEQFVRRAAPMAALTPAMSTRIVRQTPLKEPS